MSIQDIDANIVQECRVRNSFQEVAAPEKTSAMLCRIASRYDEKSFEMLLHRHGHEIMCLTKRLLHDSVAVEDAFQETLLRIWRGTVHFRATEEVVAKGWIMRIARNTTLNFLRKEKKLSRRAVDCVWETSTECKQPARNLYEGHLHKRIFDEIHRLPEKHQKPLRLRFYSGLNDKELSIKLRCGASTARARVHRALNKLRKIIRSKQSSVTDNSEFCSGEATARSPVRLKRPR